MKKLTPIILALLLCIACKNEHNSEDTAKAKNSTEATTTKPEFAIIIHGGAGTILKKNMTPEKEAAYKAKLKEAISVGYDVLKNGGSSLDAVTKTINVMEDSPLFNAGKGAVFTNAETNELDASIMDGKTLNAGASAGTTNVKHPIDLARAIMDKSEHVMMAGSGAEKFAQEQGLEIVDPKYFYTERRFNSLQNAKKREQVELDHDDKTAFYDEDIKDYKFGTVGCAALDKDGNLAAGTSTGGMTNKRWGRVGDAPIIGSGTYAKNATCAISSTGWGEYFIRGVVAYDVSCLMEYKGLSLKEAAHIAIDERMAEIGGDGGLIAVDNMGNMALPFNTEGMYRASRSAEQPERISIYKD